MGNPNPHPGRKIQKGQVLNPNGARAHNPEIKKLRKLTQEDVAIVGQLIIQNNVEQMKKIVQSPESTVLQVWMSSVAMKGIQKGDSQALDVLLNRIIGKVKEKVEVSVGKYDHLTNEEIIIQMKEKLKEIE